MSDLTAPGVRLAQVLNQLDANAHGSALTMSHSDLLARIVNAVSDGPDVSRLRLSENALLAALYNAVAGGPTLSHLTSSRGQLLAAINNLLSDGPDLSPLTTSEAALFDAAFQLVGAGGGGGGGVDRRVTTSGAVRVTTAGAARILANTPQAQRASFGWVSAGGAGANCCFSGEHDASSVTNNTGSTVLVDQVCLMGLTGGAGASVECALYADSAGSPGALLGETAVVVAALGDNIFTLAAPVSVANGVAVWVAVRCSATLAASGGSGAGFEKYKLAAWPAAFTNPFGASTFYPLTVPAQLRGNVG